MTPAERVCPVCGKGDYRMLPTTADSTGPMHLPVSHLDCVRQLKGRLQNSEQKLGYAEKLWG